MKLAALKDEAEVSHALVSALERETNGIVRNRLASLVGRSDPAEAARIYGHAALVLAAALDHAKNNNERDTLASGLVELTGRLEPAEAARIYRLAAPSLAGAVARDTRDNDGENDRLALSSLAARMAPDEAARVLADALKQGSNAPGLADLAQILSATLNRLNDAEANRVCEQLIESLDPDSFDLIAPELLQHLNPGKAHALAWDLASRMCSEREARTYALSPILTDGSREQRARRAALMASGGAGLEGMLAAAVRIIAEPFPCRLTTQELVELLKMPTCFGQDRRIVLDHLRNRYHRRFVNHWAFVRFATEQRLDLDFTTPPKRPDHKGSLKRMRRRTVMEGGFGGFQ